MTVYVLQCQQTRNIKIGYTSRLVQSRIAELRTAASTPIELVKWYPGLTEAHERQLHATLGQYRVAGEWFRHEALYHVDNAAEELFASGERDFTTTCQGQSVSAQTASVSIAVLKLNGQNLKASIINQLPKAKFEDVFWLDEDTDLYDLASNAKAWGWVKLKDTQVALIEIDGILFVYPFGISWGDEQLRFSYLISMVLFNSMGIEGKGRVVQYNGFYYCEGEKGKNITLTETGKMRAAGYEVFLESLPQLFLA